MEAHGKITAVFEPAAEGGYVAYVEEIPGINSQGETLDEARENLREALEMILEVRRELAAEQTEGRPVIREAIRLVA